MEIDNIMDALSIDGVTEIVQYCECEYNNQVLEFRLINDEFGVIDDIEFKVDDEWTLDFPESDDETMSMIIDAINRAPYEVFHKSDVGAELRINRESIKPQNVPAHLKTDFYVDEEEGPIVFTLKKNCITLD